MQAEECKSANRPEACAKVESDFRVRSTDYGGKVGAEMCKGANRPELLCKSGKVGRLNQISEYGVQITEEPGHKQVGAWLCRALVMFRRAR